MAFVKVDKDALIQLLAEPEVVKVSTFTHTCECGSRLENGYCRNEQCPRDWPGKTYGCDACGHCSTPGKCVVSIECPFCSVGISELCLDSRNSPTGYHEERWNEVNERFGTHYTKFQKRFGS